jgi:two-component system sensor histidine kinase TtrS
LIFKHTFEKEHIHVTKEMDDTNVIIDPVLIQQVIANLIQNSIDALKETPKLNRVITIGTKVSEQQVFLSISDNGCGISDEQLYELFMPFKSNKETGLGLGMVICKRIIEAHQGTIHVKQLAQGTQFSIAFPLTQPKEPS